MEIVNEAVSQNFFRKMWEILMFTLYGNTVLQILISFLVFYILRFLLGIFFTKVQKKLLIRNQTNDNRRGSIILDSFLSIPKLFFTVVSIYIPILFISFPGSRGEWIQTGFTFILGIQIVQIFYKLVFFAADELIFQPYRDEGFDQNTQAVVEFFMKIVVWIIGGLFILTNVGINVTPLIASLGVGGIAVGFALQNILSDMFSSISIFFDKPFKVGDFIIVGTDMGTVKDISLKSTRIQTLSGQQLILPNKDVTSSRINNFSGISRRRHAFTIGVIYETPSKTLRKIPEIIENVVKKQDVVDFGRAVFNGFGDFSLDFSIVYHVNQGDFASFSKTNQEIYLGIVEAFEKNGIEFAYPTQVVYAKTDEETVGTFKKLTHTAKK